MAESSPNGQKILWEKEKLLVMSNFFFSHSVLKRILLQTCENQGLFGKGLILSQMTNFDSSKLKEFADNDFIPDENGRNSSKHNRKDSWRRNCFLQAFSPFPTVFSKELYCRHKGLFWKGFIVTFLCWIAL